MPWRTNLDGRPARDGFSRTDAMIVVVVVGFIIMLVLLVSNGFNRHPSGGRRMTCRNNLKQIGLAIHNYAQANKVFPPGTICTTDPIQPGNQYDVWAEAGETGEGPQGTSFLLRIMPYIEGDMISKNWNYDYGISSDEASSGGYTNAVIAQTDIYGFYCPTRRGGIRPGTDDAMLLHPSWTGGGTDYGGCAGRHAAFTIDTGYNLCDASTYYSPNFYPNPFTAATDTDEDKRWGVFGRVNKSTSFADIHDGTSNTIMTGELQRITDATPGSKDGWAIGGPATLFTTGAMFSYDGGKLTCTEDLAKGKLMNNHFFGSPGSDHPGGAHFGLADGSVTFMSDSMDPTVFALMGSMADGEPVSIY